MSRALGFLLFLWGTSAWCASDGKPVAVKADGTEQSYSNPGGNGSNGQSGSDGYNPGCSSTGGPSSVSQPSGGDGGSGGNGEDGGDGGDITAYYTDISLIRKIKIRNTPGKGGYGGAGGDGGWGCRCDQYSWWIEDVPGSGQGSTYYCTDGSNGSDGAAGANGSPGAYGRIFLIEGYDPLKPSLPSVLVDMAKMETGSIALSQNNYEKLKGARALFAPGSDISDNYFKYRGRTELEYSFQWKANRPLSSFSGWQMRVALEGTEGKVTFPNGLMVDSEVVPDGTKRLFIIHSALTTGEVANLKLGDLSGNGTKLAIQIKDASSVSDIVESAVLLKYWTLENGNYKIRYQANVPSEAVSVSPNGIAVAIGQLGIKEDYLKAGLRTYVGVIVTRSLEGKSQKIEMGNYYVVRALDPGAKVEVIEDAKLYVGNQVVGEVKQGDTFKLSKIQDGWGALENLDGTPVKGWIKLTLLKVSEEER